MERLTIPDEPIEGGLKRAIIDARAVREEAMTIYWRLKKYEDTGLTPEEIMDGKMLTGWIPVEEKLPEDDGDYLCTYTVLVNGSRKYLCHELSYELDKWYFDGYCQDNICEIDGDIMACEAAHLGLSAGEKLKYDILKEVTARRGAAVSITKNDETERAFDEAIRELLAFEKQHNINL